MVLKRANNGNASCGAAEYQSVRVLAVTKCSCRGIVLILCGVWSGRLLHDVYLQRVAVGR